MMQNKQNLILIIAIIVVAGVIAYGGYIVLHSTTAPSVKAPAASAPAAPSVAPVAPALVSATTTPQSLGTTIYEQSQNPLQGKVPVAGNPAVNPIEGVYKNPFQ